MQSIGLPVPRSAYRKAGSPGGVRLLVSLWNVFLWLCIATVIHLFLFHYLSNTFYFKFKSCPFLLAKVEIVR